VNIIDLELMYAAAARCQTHALGLLTSHQVAAVF